MISVLLPECTFILGALQQSAPGALDVLIRVRLGETSPTALRCAVGNRRYDSVVPSLEAVGLLRRIPQGRDPRGRWTKGKIIPLFPFEESQERIPIAWFSGDDLKLPPRALWLFAVWQFEARGKPVKVADLQRHWLVEPIMHRMAFYTAVRALLQAGVLQRRRLSDGFTVLVDPAQGDIPAAERRVGVHRRRRQPTETVAPAVTYWRYFVGRQPPPSERQVIRRLVSRKLLPAWEAFLRQAEANGRRYTSVSDAMPDFIRMVAEKVGLPLSQEDILAAEVDILNGATTFEAWLRQRRRQYEDEEKDLLVFRTLTALVQRGTPLETYCTVKPGYTANQLAVYARVFSTYPREQQLRIAREWLQLLKTDAYEAILVSAKKQKKKGKGGVK